MASINITPKMKKTRKQANERAMAVKLTLIGKEYKQRSK